MATRQAQDSWFNSAVGRAMNPDNAYGLQCKDVADDYCVTLFGNWINTIKPGNGKDVFTNASATYFDKIANDPNNPNQIPQHGDIINWGASRAVPEGHVAVVDSATINNVTVIMQDGYLQYPAKRVTLGYQLTNGAMVIGWLRPKLDPEVANATVEEVKQAYRDILEREADQGGIDTYTKRTLDFVRADLRNSDEYKTLQANKAAAAKAAADEATRKAAEAAEANRIAEEKAAAERARVAAEQAVQETADAEAKAKATYTESDRTRDNETNNIIKLIWAFITSIFKGVK